MSVGSAAGVAAAQLVDGSVSTVQDVDVSRVQTILNNTFQQRIHGPPGQNPPPKPGPTAIYYNVSGAGSPEWNGHYKRTTEQYGGYVSESCPTCALYSFGGEWRFAVEGRELFYVATEVHTFADCS